MVKPMPALAQKLIEIIKKRLLFMGPGQLKKKNLNLGNDKAPPSPLVPRIIATLTKLDAATFLLEADSLEVARQFTIIESKIFCAINWYELIGQEWSKKENSHAINVRKSGKVSTMVFLF